MNSRELVVVCDDQGRRTGTARRGRVRAEGLWHETTSVLVRSGDGTRVFVHRRSPGKDVYPAMHDCWAGGVVGAGETPEECARREVAEELGVTGVPLRPLFRFRFEKPPVRHHCYTFQTRWDGPVTLQPEEITDGWWMPLDELRERAADPSWPLVPDGRAAIRRWLAGPRVLGGARALPSTHGWSYRYWPVLLAVSIARPESWFLPVTSVRM